MAEMPRFDVIRIRGEEYAVTQCGVCGVWYVVPLFVHQRHYWDGGYSYCPNGHTWGWHTGAENAAREAVRRERDQLKQDAARLEQEIAAERARAEAAEKRIVEVRRRATAGVCPCCSRTFSDVQRHMLTKHPNVVPLAQKEAAESARKIARRRAKAKAREQ